MGKLKEFHIWLKELLLMTPKGASTFLRHKFQHKEYVVNGSCKGCGNCCTHINLDMGGQWIKSKKEFRRLVQDYPEYSRFKMKGVDSFGHMIFTCSWLTEEGKCKDHENRLRICREYPVASMKYMGGDLGPGCGYRIEERPQFERIIKKKLNQTDVHP